MDRVFSMIARQIIRRLAKRAVGKAAPQFNQRRVADAIRVTRRIGRM